MVTVRAHGGNCCGAYHLYGFTEEENRDPGLIDTAVRNVPERRLIEVILNQRQVVNFPNVLQRLADLGFVLVGHSRNGNHGYPGSNNYVFHRASFRDPLLAGPINGRWNGMVITPDLMGALPQQDADIVPGTRCRINSPRSARNNQVHEVIRVNGEGLIFNDGQEFAIIRANVVVVHGEAAQIHRDNQVVEGQQPQPQPQPQPPTVVYSLYRNHYRTTGRSVHLYADRATAIGARRGAANVRLDRLNIYSDGTRLIVEGV